MRIDIDYYGSGTPGRVELAKGWLESTWDNRVELQLQSKGDFVDGFVDRMLRFDRIEIGVFEITGSGAENLQAAAIVTIDDDVHVGATLSVEVAYSATPGMGKVLMRQFHSLARTGGLKTIRVIKRTAAYTYTVRYVQTKE